jgi:transcriptional antiterminator NusG
MQTESETIHQKAYGCISVNVGDEVTTAMMIRNSLPDIEALAIMKVKHNRCKGFRSNSCAVMIPGYILFSANSDVSISQILTIHSVNRILKYDNSDWHMRGDDLLFSKWIFDNNGTIGVSVAFIENDEIKILDGPLKQVEGKIIRVSKRSRCAQVALGLKQQVFKVWLPFEWMEQTADMKTKRNYAKTS